VLVSTSSCSQDDALQMLLTCGGNRTAQGCMDDMCLSLGS
jgi:hypothetical protein